MKLSIIIVNYNVKHYLMQCLESLRKAKTDFDWEVFVVDNNSKDDSIAYLRQTYTKESFPQLTIIANQDNPGFGKANNQAYAQATGEYILYLNPDTFISEDTLETCVNFMDQHADAGCIGVKMLNSNGTFAMESRRGVPTPWASFCKITRLSKLFPNSKKFGLYYLQHLPIDQPAKIDIVSGAFMMVRHEIVDKVGIFDEDYFMYCEDTDLSYRMLKSGYQNYYIPTQILHYKGESTRKLSYNYVNTFYKAILIFFNKHFNDHIFILRIIIYIAIYLIAALSFINRQCVRIKYAIKKKVAPQKIKVLFAINKEHNDIATAIAQANNLDYRICNTTAGHQLKDEIRDFNPNYIAYDTSSMTYKEILKFANTLPAELAHDIATFYPHQQKLITNLYIFNGTTA